MLTLLEPYFLDDNKEVEAEILYNFFTQTLLDFFPGVCVCVCVYYSGC